MIEMLKDKVEHAELAGNLCACMRLVIDTFKNIVDIGASADACAHIRAHEIKQEAE